MVYLLVGVVGSVVFVCVTGGPLYTLRQPLQDMCCGELNCMFNGMKVGLCDICCRSAVLPTSSTSTLYR